MKLNGSEVNFGCFPNKELNLPIDGMDILPTNLISWGFKTNEDIIKLAMLATHLNSMNSANELYIEYLPYSRMDRVNIDYSFSLKFIADMINNMGFTKVIIREPHSDVSLSLINNSSADWWCANRVNGVIEMCLANSVFYPDAGAKIRYKDVSGFPHAFGKKKRTFETGSITAMTISGTVGDRVLIVDDLCSRGGTFIKGAKMLKDKGAKNVCLLVAHCENNVFTGEIFDHIDVIFTSYGMLDEDHPRITKIK